MKAEFVDAWKSLFPSRALVHILSQTPSLRALRVLMGELTGPSSGWSRFSLGRTRSLPVGYAISHALSSFPHFSLPEMKILEVDALEDIEPLTAITPNLEVLHMNLSSGYDIYANGRLINALKHVPRLRELAYSPESLRMGEILEMQESPDDDEMGTAQEAAEMNDGSAEFIRAIGQVVPSLETLDLQTRWYGEDIRFVESSEPISSNALKEGLITLSNLKNVTIPSSVSSVIDHKVFIAASPDQASFSIALSNSTAAERALAVELGKDNSNLKSISFVRPVSTIIDPHCRPTQFSVTYTLNSTPERTIFMGYNLSTIIYPGTTEVHENVHIQSAEYGQVDMCPKTNRAFPFQQIIDRFMKEQQITMTVIVIAGATAFAVSEAGKLLGV